MFIHFTWLVLFLWLHFLFQWFWFLSITERPEFVLLKATVKKIWLRQNQKGLKLANIKPLLEKPQPKDIKTATSYVELRLPWWNILIFTYWMYEFTLQYYKRSFVRRLTIRSTQLTPNTVFETWSILEYCVNTAGSRTPPSRMSPIPLCTYG